MPWAAEALEVVGWLSHFPLMPGFSSRLLWKYGLDASDTVLLCLAIGFNGIAWGHVIGTLVKLWSKRLGRAPNVCAACGYDLRGTRSDTCPECGADRWG